MKTLLPLGPGDLTVTAGLRVLRTAKYRLKHNREIRTRVTKASPPGWKAGLLFCEAYDSPEIYHDGRWKALCRTDLTDNVTTGLVAHKTLAEWKRHYVAKLRRGLGLRVTRTTIAVIDAYSDG